MEAANLVIKEGWSTRQVARHTGFDHSTIVRWVAKARISNRNTILTESSRAAPPSAGTPRGDDPDHCNDHGSEFSKWFTKRILERGMAHRHSRVRQPNDNAHLERFNRTLQEECLARSSRSLTAWRRALPAYLHWYNEERPHLGLDMRTPLDVVRSY
jgi:hypothetical protein